jgi:hypothetical protein
MAAQYRIRVSRSKETKNSAKVFSFTFGISLWALLKHVIWQLSNGMQTDLFGPIVAMIHADVRILRPFPKFSISAR